MSRQQRRHHHCYSAFSLTMPSSVSVPLFSSSWTARLATKEGAECGTNLLRQSWRYQLSGAVCTRDSEGLWCMERNMFWVTEASGYGPETMESILGLTLSSRSRFRAHLYEACLEKRGIWPKKSKCLYSKCDGGGSRGLPRYKNIIGKPHYRVIALAME